MFREFRCKTYLNLDKSSKITFCDNGYIYTNTFHDAPPPPPPPPFQNIHALYHCIIVARKKNFVSMVVMYGYESDCPSNDSDQDELGSRQIRKVYLVTYNQTDIETFPTRTYIAEAVLKSFSGSSANVLLAKMPPNVMHTLAYLSKVQQKTSVGCVQKKFWLTSKAYLSGPFLKPPRQCLHFFGSMWE